MWEPQGKPPPSKHQHSTPTPAISLVLGHWKPTNGSKTSQTRRPRQRLMSSINVLPSHACWLLWQAAMAVYLNALARGVESFDWAAFLIDISKRISDCLFGWPGRPSAIGHQLLCRQLQLKRMLNGSDMTARPTPGSDKMNYGPWLRSKLPKSQSQSQSRSNCSLLCHLIHVEPVNAIATRAQWMFNDLLIGFGLLKTRLPVSNSFARPPTHPVSPGSQVFVPISLPSLINIYAKHERPNASGIDRRSVPGT